MTSVQILGFILVSMIGYGECDIIEHNFVEGSNGAITLRQYMFREYSDITCEYVTLAWALDYNCDKAGNYVDENGRPYAIWAGTRSNKQYMIIKAYCLVGTITDFDPERTDAHKYPLRYRWPSRKKEW